MTIEYLSFIRFVARLLLDPSTSSPSSFMTSSFLIQMVRWIRGSSRVEFFIFLSARGIFFESWIFLSSVAPFFFSIIMSCASSYVCSTWSLSESNHFLLAQIPWMNESHDLGRSFKVVITNFAFSTSSSTTSSCSLIWETLVKYDCMVSAFWIFTFFNYFLKAIF